MPAAPRLALTCRYASPQPVDKRALDWISHHRLEPLGLFIQSLDRRFGELLVGLGGLHQ
jgi:hypothetical protein